MRAGQGVTAAIRPSPPAVRSERERIAGRIRNLEARARLNAELRRFFAAREFLEIEAPILVPSPGLELHLDAFAADDKYLITSPEYQMKRLLAGGLTRIYSLCKVFRRGELGRHHNPEFTMLEWYRADKGWQAIADDVEQLVFEMAEAVAGASTLAGCDVTPPWERLSVREAMARYASVDLEGDESPEALREKARAAGHRVDADGDFGDVFFTVFLDAVEPRLGRQRPVIVYDWPAPLGALARRRADDPRLVERFEAYAAGLELCNAFGELTDPVEQRARLDADLEKRKTRGLALYPIDERFLTALAQMPPAAGVALGVDRLAMLLCGAADIREVLPFKLDEL